MARRTWGEVRNQRLTDNPELETKIEEAKLRMDLAQFVYDLRSAAGITQSELAERMKTIQSAIARLEGGGTNATAELLQHLGNALGVRLVLTVESRAGSNSTPVVISDINQTRRAS